MEQSIKIKSASKTTVEAILSEVTVVNFGSKEAIWAAKIRNNLRTLGTPISSYDFLIAATALANGLTLVTSNEKEFARLPELRIENWRVR